MCLLDKRWFKTKRTPTGKRLPGPSSLYLSQHLISCNISCACPILSQKSRRTARQLQPTHRLTYTQPRAQAPTSSEDTQCFPFFGGWRGGDEELLSKDVCWTSRICVSKPDTAYSPTNRNRNSAVFPQHPHWAKADWADETGKDETRRQRSSFFRTFFTYYFFFYKTKTAEQNITVEFSTQQPQTVATENVCNGVYI